MVKMVFNERKKEKGKRKIDMKGGRKGRRKEVRNNEGRKE